jgi:hypothetical protein
MDTVANFIMKYLIPLRIDINDESYHETLHTFWTPTLVVIDPTGHEVQREIGFFQPTEFIASLHLGLAKARMSSAEFDIAEEHFSSLIGQLLEGDIVPEAILFQGVNNYKMKNDPGELKKAYERLVTEFPDTFWAKRAAPYRLL